MIAPERIAQFNVACGYSFDPQADYDAEHLHWMNQREYAELVDKLSAMPNAQKFNSDCAKRIEEIKNLYAGRNPLHCGVPNA